MQSDGTYASPTSNTYGANEYGYGGGYDPTAYGWQEDYSGGLMGGQNTTGYMSTQPDIIVTPSYDYPSDGQMIGTGSD